MNLEELKEIWTSHAGSLSENEYLNHNEIRNLLHKRSQGALAKINRNILYEMLASAALGIGVVYWLLTRKEEVSVWEILLFAAMFITAGFFYFFKYKSLNRNEIQTDNLMESLESVTQSMGRYMRFYLYTLVFLIPTLAFGGGYYAWYLRRLSLGAEESLFSFKEWLMLGGGMLIYAILATFTNNWYHKKLYGTHFKELKSCLAELKEL